MIRSLGGLALLTTALLAVGTIGLAGQPIYANDTWIHLALGRAFAADGPWLTEDPYLFAAPAPPAPSSWLGSVGIYLAYLAGGFTGLRIAHALGVLAILVLVWRLLRKSGVSAPVAAAGVAGFVVLATYRLAQLRPDLFTIGAALALYPAFVADRDGPDRLRIGVAALLAAVWANVHAAFVLGPVLLLGTAAFVAGASFLPAPDAARHEERFRAARIAAAGIAMLAGSCLNPQGVSAVLAYSAAGATTPGLESVSDEWNPTRLFAWPVPFLPPTVAAWLLTWLCVIGVAGATVLFLRQRMGRAARGTGIDPALLALAIGGLVAAVSASRFLWLGVFALALLGKLVEPDRADRRAFTSTMAAVFTVAAVALHVEVGDWPLVSRAIRAEGADYRDPYPAERFNTTDVWLLADTAVEGRIFNDYPLGGFMSFWLAPRIQMASSGTMNVSKEAMEANLAIAARQPLRPRETYADLLDRQGLDLFLGLGFPIAATPGRPIPCTVRHLEREPGWILVFRNLRSAIYLRRNARNEDNLNRIASYYERAGVPFDRENGFDAGRVVSEASAWAIRYGLVPAEFDRLVASVGSGLDAGRTGLDAQRLGSLYAVLGLYDQALELDRRIRRIAPDDVDSAWRMLWTLAQLGRWKDAFGVAANFERRFGPGPASAAYPWSAALERMRATSVATRTTLVAHLPLLRADQLAWVRDGIESLPPRMSPATTAP